VTVDLGAAIGWLVYNGTSWVAAGTAPNSATFSTGNTIVVRPNDTLQNNLTATTIPTGVTLIDSSARFGIFSTTQKLTNKGSVNFCGSSLQTIPGQSSLGLPGVGSSNGSWGNIVINNPAGVTSTQVTNNAFHVNNITLQSGTFTATADSGNSVTLYIDGAVSTSGGNLTTTTNGATNFGVFLYGNSGAQTLPAGTFVGNTTGRLSINNAAGATTSGPLTVDSTLYLTATGTGTTFTANGNLAVNGLSITSLYSKARPVTVTGTATLNGTVTIGGFTIYPVVNQRYTLLKSTAGISGAFNATPVLPGGFAGTVTTAGDSVVLTLTAVPTPSAGDVFYFQPASGDAGILSNWNTVPNGTGYSPPSITRANCFYVIDGGRTATISGTFGGPNVLISVGDETGGSLGTGTAGALTVASSCTSLQANIDVNAGSTLYINMAPGATQTPILQTLLPNSTVVYGGTGLQSVLPANYGNLTIDNGAGVTLPHQIGVSGTLSSIAGTMDATTHSANITFNGVGAQTIPGNALYTGGNAYDITIDNDSSVTLGTGDTLTVADTLTVNSGAFIQGAGSKLIVQGASYVPSSPTLLDSIHKAGYTLVWHDEFNGAGGSYPNPAIWTRHYSSSLLTNTYLDGQGHLAVRVNDSLGTYYGGDVQSLGATGAYQKQYGYFEARILLSPNRGINNTFWLQSKYIGSDTSAHNAAVFGTEMDIMEYLGPGTPAPPYGQVNSTVHYNGYGPTEQSYTDEYSGGNSAGANAVSGTGWHIIAMEWSPTNCNFYVDNVLVWTMNNAAFVSKRPEYIILGAGTGWNLPPNQTGNVYPTTVLYDYVRVYNKN
jgi:hypothetical protein